MCNLSEGVWEKGMAQGMTEGMANGILASLINLIETMCLTIEQAAAALKVPENERQKYIDLLERQ